MIMPETPKKRPANEEKPDNSTWEEDQKRREYYYDDAHGYEKYDPEKDDEIESDDLTDDSDTKAD